MFACKDLTPRRMCAGPEHSSSGMYKRCRENASTCMNIWLLNQAFCLLCQISLLEIPFSDTIKRKPVFQMNVRLLQRASQDLYLPRVSISCQETVGNYCRVSLRGGIVPATFTDLFNQQWNAIYMPFSQGGLLEKPQQNDHLQAELMVNKTRSFSFLKWKV